MKVGICSLGCKVNIYESEVVTDLLKKGGYEIVPFEDKADIYIPIYTLSLMQYFLLYGVVTEADKLLYKIHLSPLPLNVWQHKHQYSWYGSHLRNPPPRKPVH